MKKYSKNYFGRVHLQSIMLTKAVMKSFSEKTTFLPEGSTLQKTANSKTTKPLLFSFTIPNFVRMVDSDKSFRRCFLTR